MLFFGEPLGADGKVLVGEKKFVWDYEGEFA